MTILFLASHWSGTEHGAGHWHCCLRAGRLAGRLSQSPAVMTNSSNNNNNNVCLANYYRGAASGMASLEPGTCKDAWPTASGASRSCLGCCAPIRRQSVAHASEV